VYQARTTATSKTGLVGAFRNGWVFAARNGASLIPVALLILALFTRLMWSNVPINIDETAWIRRGSAFLLALMNGNLSDTFLRHHPGVTNMWLIGAGLRLHYLLRGLMHPDVLMLSSPNLLDYLDRLATGAPVPLEAYISARVISGLVSACCLVGIYILSKRLFGRPAALIAIIILLLEPFFVAYQRSLTTDANETNFLWLALLAFLLYLRRAIEMRPRSWGWLCSSGVFYGLAVLSKAPALLTLPAFAVAAIWLAWRRRLDRGWLRVALDLALWGATALVTVVALWPALWVSLWIRSPAFTTG
jgi:Dolichyl-phosphate-mannose-protein mannosyltransferase